MYLQSTRKIFNHDLGRKFVFKLEYFESEVFRAQNPTRVRPPANPTEICRQNSASLQISAAAAASVPVGRPAIYRWRDGARRRSSAVADRHRRRRPGFRCGPTENAAPPVGRRSRRPGGRGARNGRPRGVRPRQNGTDRTARGPFGRRRTEPSRV